MVPTSAAPAVSPSLATAVAARALSEEPDPALRAAVAQLAAAGGETLDGLLFFGSRRTGAARADAWSAYDVIAVVGRYRPFYRALHGAGFIRRRPFWLSLLSRWLPPTQLSLRFREPELHVKLGVLTLSSLRRETSARRRDHFTIGRLFQPVRLEHWRDETAREAILACVVAAHAATWQWLRPWLPSELGADDYGRAALATSLAWEVRPEPAGRAEALWAAQRELQLPVFAALLGELEQRGELVPAGSSGVATRWRVATPVGRAERLRCRLYFGRSLLRATLRWLKHVLTFEDWLEYIVRKASRHSGEAFELTPRERRWPLLFLWGRFFRYFRHKNRRVA